MVAGFVSAVPATAATGTATAVGGSQLWATTTGTPQRNDGGTAMAVSPDGRTVFVTSNDGAVGLGNNHAETVAYSAAAGAVLWRAPFSRGKKYASQLDSVAVSPDGSTVFVVGTSGIPGTLTGLTQLTVAYNAATGALLWMANGAVTGNATSLAVSPDGATVYVSGPPQTEAYKATTGALLWSNPVVFAANAIALSADGATVFITGHEGGSGNSAITAALNTATGATLWQAIYKQAPGSDFTSIGLSPGGSAVFVAGTVGDVHNPSSTTVLVTVAYRVTTGARLWASSSGKMLHYSTVNGLAVSPAGSAVFVTESVQTTNIDFQERTIALNPATGAALWRNTFNSPTPPKNGSYAKPAAIVTSPGGSTVYVTGYETTTLAHRPGLPPQMHEEYVTIAYSSAGKMLWTARYSKRVHDYPFAMAVSADGSRVFVTGVSEPFYGTGQFDYTATVAYKS
jgi:sugar lactone lactonase YvrE